MFFFPPQVANSCEMWRYDAVCVRRAVIEHLYYMCAIKTFEWAMCTRESKTKHGDREAGGGPVAKYQQVLKSPAVTFGCN